MCLLVPVLRLHASFRLMLLPGATPSTLAKNQLLSITPMQATSSQVLESDHSCAVCRKVGAGYVVAEGAELRDEVLARAPRVSAT